MDAVSWFWTVVGALFVCWILKCVYMRYYGATGRHHDYWIEWDGHVPHGTVWRSKAGVWMTQPRRDWPKPRRFDQRSNPLDHELIVEKYPQPIPMRTHYEEVEY